MSKQAMKPGIHAWISFQEYLAIDAVNNSTLKLFRRTPAHARHAMTRPDKDTSAYRTGDACHAAILEPERFEKEYVRTPKFDKRTNKGKAEAAQWALDHPKHVPLLPDEWDLATAMRDSARKHPTAIELLSAKGRAELTVIWTDEPTGLLCKGRLDWFTTYEDKVGTWSAIVDVKTSKNISEREFLKDVAKYFYHQQAAFYLDGLDALAPLDRRFIFLAIEKEPPYCIICYELDETAIEEGRAQYRKALDMLAECKKSGEWPGYAPGVYGVDIPKYSYELTTPPK